jgi:hypothetical protein
MQQAHNFRYFLLPIRQQSLRNYIDTKEEKIDSTEYHNPGRLVHLSFLSLYVSTTTGFPWQHKPVDYTRNIKFGTKETYQSVLHLKLLGSQKAIS